MKIEKLESIINKATFLKHKYLGSYSSNKIPVIEQNTFILVNTTPSTQKDSHWIFLGRRWSNIVFYGDSLGRPMAEYEDIQNILSEENVKILTDCRLQQLEICGLYCIYFAWRVFSGYPVDPALNDVEVLTFVYGL